MSPVAGILLILSAVTHAGWNFISKKHHPTLAFYLMANNVGVLLVLPILFPFWDKLSLIPAFVWICLNCSGFFLAAYMAALAGAYRSGDMSIAYPLARAFPIIFVTVITMILGLGKTLSVWFIFGAALIVAGCIIVPIRSHRNLQIRDYMNLCCLLSVLAAVCISGYTLIDNEALACLRNLPGRPFGPVGATLVYMALEAIICSVWKGIWVIASQRERKAFFVVIRDYKMAAAITGIGIYLTYGLVLTSMNYVTNVSYVAAFRQLSIPLGTLMGIVFLKEPPHRAKIFGVLSIFVGLVIVGLQ